MNIKKVGEYTGKSANGLSEAIANALAQSKEHSSYKVHETTKSFGEQSKKEYEVTLSTFSE
ncbi:MAG: hypothetical protein CL570_06965 [Alphaproteobacteria bacterium]|nr:hypothetical protein [Alphaproteobacteria bacterium]|tara:strand:+ start:543 stop:725 length:183 start_codon:yes stop_codon:yes gene_type:complete